MCVYYFHVLEFIRSLIACFYVLGEGTLLGRRKKNEDRTHVEQLQDDIMLFAIYDGHGGDVSSQ